MSEHQVVHHEYIQISFVSLTSIKLGDERDNEALKHIPVAKSALFLEDMFSISTCIFV